MDEQPDDRGPSPPGWNPPSWQPPAPGTPGWSPTYWHGPPPATDHPLALIAFIVGIVALLFMCLFSPLGLVGIVAVVLGHIARRDIRAQPGRYRNSSFALAGYIMGWIATGLALLMTILLAVLFGTLILSDVPLE